MWRQPLFCWTPCRCHIEPMTVWIIYSIAVSYCTIVCARVLPHFSRVRFFVTLWTVAHQDLPSMGFSRQEYWSRLPCPSPGDLPDPGIKPLSLISFTLPGRCFTTGTTWEAPTLQAEQANSYRD